MVEGISASQFSAMKVLRIHGKLAQRDIAKHILKSFGNITNLVDNLEAMELVSRDRDSEDRRIVYVSLTPKGEALFDDLYPEHLKRICDAMEKLSETESKELLGLLEKLHPAMDTSSCTASPAEAAESILP